MSTLTADYDFHLPEELIASRPLENRAASRMLVLHRATGKIEHRHFSDILEYKQTGDRWIFNDTRVVPARFFSDDGKIELLKLESPDPQTWRSLVKPGRKMKVGRSVVIGGITGTVTQIYDNGDRLIEWDSPIDPDEHGELALPHYMGREEDDSDRERYQTIYAREEGAIAAPTAGLHFTDEIMQELPHDFLTLHVGVGTFRPVKADDVKDHDMHSEHFDLPAETAKSIRAAERVVAVGTTVTRVLEHIGPDMTPGSGSTNIFLHPPKQLQVVDALLTNFHLPQSTLIMLVSAFAGRENVLAAYKEAVEKKYRFYSYGDCMLIV